MLSSTSWPPTQASSFLPRWVRVIQYCDATDVPDIDLCWHTHQLKGQQYEFNTRKYVGWFVDHDDKVADVTLKGAFDSTSQLWAERFHSMYSGCACPVAPEGRLRKFLSGRRTTAATVPKEAALLNAATGAQPEVSCPSTHNKVLLDGDWGMDSARSKKLGKDRATRNVNHPNPFITISKFSPRNATQLSPSQPPEYMRKNASVRPYWGITPFQMYGPHGIANPWCLPAPGISRSACGGGLAGCASSGTFEK